jgi:zinc protease
MSEITLTTVRPSPCRAAPSFPSPCRAAPSFPSPRGRGIKGEGDGRKYARGLLFAVILFLMSLPAQGHAAGKRFLDIQEVKSGGGITAWLVEDHDQHLISVDFAFRGAGADLDPADKQGLARMVSNTLNEGAGDLDSQAFQKALADNSIALAFSADRDDLTGEIKTLTRHRDLAFNLLKLAVTAPRFDQEAVDRMRAANIARIRSSMSDPDWMAARLVNAVAFAGHPYAMNTGGTPTSLNKITAADLKNWAAAHLDRAHLLVTVTGDISAADLKVLLDKTFGGLPEKAVYPGIADYTVQNGGQTVLYEQDIPQSEIQIIQPGIGRDDPDYHTLQVLNLIFGGNGFGSRLMTEVREKRGLTYGIFSGPVLLRHLKALSIDTATKSGNEAEVLALVRQEMNRIRDNDVSAKELSEAKSYIIGSMPLELTSTNNISALMLTLRLDELPSTYLDAIKDRINAVTVADVRRVAKRILTPDKLTVILVGRKPAGVTPTRTLDKLPDVD